MATTVLPYTHLQYFDNAGDPLSGGSLSFFIAGTSTPLDTYYDIDLAVGHKNPNPLPLNSAGRPVVSGNEVNIYTTASTYKIILKDSAGNTIWTADQVPAAASAIGLSSGTVTSVALSMPAVFSVTGSPITSAGTFTVTLAANVSPGHCEGRLTLTAGSPVTSADVTGATTIYWSPYKGNVIDLYDGSSKWTSIKFAEISVALGTLTSGLPYDVFAFNNSGVAALRSPVAWSSTTTRATAIVLQDGVYVKSGATTDRYLGTFYTTSTTQTEDSIQNRYLWNYYNRVPRAIQRVETTANWTYTTATVRQANGSTSNQVALIEGVAESPIDLSLSVWVSNNGGGGGASVSAGIGEDSLTTYAAAATGVNLGTASVTTMMGIRLTKIPTVGKHVYSWNEYSQAAGTTTWYAGGTLGSTITGGLSGLWFA